jgi:RNA polymerase sigma-70 factor (ECF subfamily)
MSDTLQFEAFVRKYQDLVYGTAIRLLGNAADAQDVAQTVFLKAFERFDTVAASPAAGGWLKTVTTNVCLNHLSRYRARWRLFSEMVRDDATDTEEPFEDRIAAREPPSLGIERASRHTKLEQVLRRLPDQQRVPLVLFHFESKSYEDIAGLLGISLGKVKTDIHRGREALKRYLEDDEQHGPGKPHP